MQRRWEGCFACVCDWEGSCDAAVGKRRGGGRIREGGKSVACEENGASVVIYDMDVMTERADQATGTLGVMGFTCRFFSRSKAGWASKKDMRRLERQVCSCGVWADSVLHVDKDRPKSGALGAC